METFDSKLAAHNVATILTKACIGEIDKEQIPISSAHPIPDFFNKYATQYSFFYKGFYNESLKHFESVLNDFE